MSAEAAAEKIEMLERELNVFRTEKAMQQKIMEQIATNINEQVDTIQKLLVQERAMFATVFGHCLNNNNSTFEETVEIAGESAVINVDSVEESATNSDANEKGINPEANSDSGSKPDDEPELLQPPSSKKSRNSHRELRGSGSTSTENEVQNVGTNSKSTTPGVIKVSTKRSNEDDNNAPNVPEVPCNSVVQIQMETEKYTAIACACETAITRIEQSRFETKYAFTTLKCRGISVGNYKVTSATLESDLRVTFSDFGLLFNLPHRETGIMQKCAVPLQTILTVYGNFHGDLSVFVVVCSPKVAWLMRRQLGINNDPSGDIFYCSLNGNDTQRYLAFCMSGVPSLDALIIRTIYGRNLVEWDGTISKLFLEKIGMLPTLKRRKTTKPPA